MKNRVQSGASGALGVVLMLCLVAVVVPAQKRSRQRANDAARHSRAAAQVFREVMKVPDKGIPRELLDKAEAVAVFPGVVKAAFVFGGRGGQGVISRRTATGWSAPAFFNLGGGSFGPQIGVQKTDYVLLIMNDDGLKGLLEDKFEFGGEASVAAGPVGRTASASTNATLDAGILSYSRSRGAFIGASLKGAAINPDNDLNEAFYGMKARDLLTGSGMSLRQMPSAVRVFPQTLAQYSTRRSHHASLEATGAAPNFVRRASFLVDSEAQTQGAMRGAQVKRTPAQLAKEVRHELLLLPYYNVFDWLEFQVEPDGTVILRGQVTSPPDTKSRAEAAAKDVEGVKRVVNEIEVLPLSPNDDRLREALYRAVYSGSLFRYAEGSLNAIHIIVKNGHATLKGEVDSAADKQLAYTQARTVSGVFEVTNDLVVRNERAR